MATKAKAAPKTRITKKQVIAHRTKVVKDHSPVWEGCAEWTIEQFMRNYRAAVAYYNLEFSGKELKPAVLKWMAANGYDAKTVEAFKKMKDWRSNSTMGAIASCLLRGMVTQRDDFNKGRDSAEWLRKEIAIAMEAGAHDAQEADAAADDKAASNVLQPSIQERVKEAAFRMTEEIEDAIESFAADPEAFDPKAFKMLNLLKGKEVKAAHARIIKGFYSRNLEELTEAATTKDEQLKEAYSHLSKANLKKITLFYQEIAAACDMLAQEAKVNRAPRAKKPTDKSKVVAKMKYMKQSEPLKLVSINPIDIIGTKELWVYNTKSRKLGRYVADDYKELGVKGTTIINFNENTSVCKTLRKPEEKLKEFKAAGKVQLRKFLDDINATDTKMNGRINEETILLKVG